MMPMGAASDSAFRQIVSAIVSSTGQGIVDAPTRIYLRRRGRSHWGSLIPTAHRIRTATREVAPRRLTDGVVRERYWRNITGFMHVEAATGGKWLSLLKEMAPGIKRAAFMFNPDTAPRGGKNFLASFEAAAGSLGIEAVAMIVRSDAEIETGIAALGAEQAGLVEYSSFLAAHVETIIPRPRATMCPRSTKRRYLLEKAA
jgi:hypothetical protein